MDESPDNGSPRSLADWQLEPRKNPNFRAEVWARIEATRKPPSWAAYARLHGPLLAGALAVALVTGALAGSVEARARVAADRDTIAREYVQSLDARTMRP